MHYLFFYILFQQENIFFNISIQQYIVALPGPNSVRYEHVGPPIGNNIDHLDKKEDASLVSAPEAYKLFLDRDANGARAKEWRKLLPLD